MLMPLPYTIALLFRPSGLLASLSEDPKDVAKLYLLTPNSHSLTDRDLSDILAPAEDPPDVPRTRDFPGETFRVLKDREMREYGEYRTGWLVLAAWDALGAGGPASSVAW